MKLRNRGSRTRIVILPKAKTSICRRTIRGSAFIASQFRGRRFSSGQFEDISGVGRVIEVAVEPPLFEGVIGEGRYWSVVVWEGLEGDVEAPHGGGEYR